MAVHSDEEGVDALLAVQVERPAHGHKGWLFKFVLGVIVIVGVIVIAFQGATGTSRPSLKDLQFEVKAEGEVALDPPKAVTNASATEHADADARALQRNKKRNTKTFQWEGSKMEIVFKTGSAVNKPRCAVFCFFTTVRNTLLDTLSERGEDWAVGNGPSGSKQQIQRFVKWIRGGSQAAKALNIKPDCIALMGYSAGGIKAGAATRLLGRKGGVQGMILLNSNTGFGTTGPRAAPYPYADYLVITGMKQDEGWVKGNEALITSIRAAGGYAKQVKLKGVDHVNWRNEKDKVFRSMATFLINRVRKR